MSNKVLRETKMSDESVLIEHLPLPSETSVADLLLYGTGQPLLVDGQSSPGGNLDSSSEPEPSPEEIARQEAEELLQSATEQAAEIIAEAEEIRSQVLAEAKEAGFNSGYSEGVEDGKEAAHRLIGVTQDIAARLLREENRMVRALEGRLSRLSVEIARKILRDELKLGQHHVDGLVKIALRRFADEEKVIVRLNPFDLETLRRDHDDLSEIMDKSETVKIIEDRRVSRGGCLVETPTGCLDARAEVQLERVAELFEVEASYGVGSPDSEHQESVGPQPSEDRSSD